MFDELAGNEQQQEQEMGQEDDLMMVEEGRVTKNEKCPYTLVPVSACEECQGGGTVGAAFGQDFREGFGRRMLGGCQAHVGRLKCLLLFGCVHACTPTPPQ